MPDYTYEALATTGKRDQGVLTATSEREAIAVLDARGLFPVRIQESRSKSGSQEGGYKLKGRHVAQVFGQLADLLRAGVSLLRALETIEKQSSHPVSRAILREVRLQVADGTSLADALAKHPRAFNELTVSMVRAGQEGGFLEDVLERIAQFTEHQEDLRAKVVGAMAYPVFLAVVGFLVLNVLIVFFVPRFKPIFERLEQKGELPGLTKALIGTSEMFQANLLPFITVLAMVCVLPFFSKRDFSALLSLGSGKAEVWPAFRAVIILAAMAMPVILLLTEQFTAAFILAFVIGVAYWLRSWMSSEEGKMTIDRWRLQVPSVGAIYLNLAIARFARILGTLMHNGIPILQGLRIAKDSTGNRVLTEALDKAGENLTQGDKLATPLSMCKFFPRDIVEMIAVGEESNQLEKVLINIADGLERRTARQLELFVRLLEPMMLLVMAVVTLIVVAALLMPVFKMSTVVQ